MSRIIKAHSLTGRITDGLLLDSFKAVRRNRGAAGIDKVSIKIIGDASAAFAALMAGDIDAYPNFPAAEQLDQFRADPRFKVVVGNTEGETILAMNNGRKPWDDVRVRRAVSMAVDRKSVIDGAMYGLAKPIGSHFPPQDAGYVDLTGKYPFDVAKAQALLGQDLVRRRALAEEALGDLARLRSTPKRKRAYEAIEEWLRRQPAASALR